MERRRRRPGWRERRRPRQRPPCGLPGGRRRRSKGLVAGCAPASATSVPPVSRVSGQSGPKARRLRGRRKPEAETEKEAEKEPEREGAGGRPRRSRRQEAEAGASAEKETEAEAGVEMGAQARQRPTCGLPGGLRARWPYRPSDRVCCSISGSRAAGRPG